MKRLAHILLIGSLSLLAACGGDDVDETPRCDDGLDFDPIRGECVRLTSNNVNNSLPIEDAGTDEADMSAPVDADEDEDMGAEEDLGCQTDEDGDGAISIACGGDDCDDQNNFRSPGSPEICDEFDNDCDEEFNEELDCSIYAHSSNRLYLVDIFAGTSTDLGETVSNLWDIDTHPDGTLYGVAGDKLHVYDETNQTWTAKPGDIGDLSPNGFCIDNDGTAYMTSGLTGTLRLINLQDGTSTEIGSTSPARSSGDCVVNKGNSLFMTSGGPSSTNDDFVKLDGNTGTSTEIGATGFDEIWALTAAYGRVFGMTESGDVVEIDVATGAATLMTTFEGIAFYGAASTPGR